MNIEETFKKLFRLDLFFESKKEKEKREENRENQRNNQRHNRMKRIEEEPNLTFDVNAEPRLTQALGKEDEDWYKNWKKSHFKIQSKNKE